jgi:hypothetical protein
MAQIFRAINGTIFGYYGSKHHVCNIMLRKLL